MREDHFFLFVVGLFAALALAIFLILPMHFLMPKPVLEQYWKMPYFRPAELVLFTDTIYAPMRTVMLMWLVAFPRFGKKRGITAADKLVPRWYKITAQILSVWILACDGIILFLVVAGTISEYLTGNLIPIPLTKG